MSSDKDIKIYICYHNKYPVLKSSILIPVQVGRALTKKRLDMQGDNEGDNISDKNPYYSELTAQYQAWKNVKCDYVGFLHYRRFLNFSGADEMYIDDLNKASLEKFGLFDEKIFEECKDFDIILPQKDTLEMSLREHYEEIHNINDLVFTLDTVKKLYPEVYDAGGEVMESDKMYCCNMFIMRKKYFDDYMKFLFDILFEVEKNININDYNDYQKRVFGFLSERLFNIYFAYLLKINPDLKIKELKMVLFHKNRNKRLFLRKFFSRNDVGFRVVYKILGIKFVVNRCFRS